MRVHHDPVTLILQDRMDGEPGAMLWLRQNRVGLGVVIDLTPDEVENLRAELELVGVNG